MLTHPARKNITATTGNGVSTNDFGGEYAYL